MGQETRTFEDVGLEQRRVELQRTVAVLDDVFVELELGVAEGPVAARGEEANFGIAES